MNKSVKVSCPTCEADFLVTQAMLKRAENLLCPVCGCLHPVSQFDDLTVIEPGPEWQTFRLYLISMMLLSAVSAPILSSEPGRLLSIDAGRHMIGRLKAGTF